MSETPEPAAPPARDARRARRRPTADERREEIVSAAIRCFAERGFHGTTTRRIAEAVGITEAALYRYFASKDALYDAIVERKLRSPSLVDAVRADAARRDDDAVFRGLARAILEAGTGDPDFVRLMFFTGLESHALATPLYVGRIEPVRAFVTSYVRSRIEEGAFRAIDPMLGARAFLGMIWDYLNVRVVHGQAEVYPQGLDEVVDTFVDLFLAGIAMGRDDGGAAPRDGGRAAASTHTGGAAAGREEGS
ncbi:MAG: TetR/AcrR family transcriptional regulator [Myxococcales bacterium]|nr:TetR/AcrR family transcriptional regulator [Myxococcales bacterium]